MTHQIELFGANWNTKADFYTDLLRALQAPGWHGQNLDALNETLRSGDTNGMNPPLQITIFGSQQMSPEALLAARRFVALCDDLADDGVAIDAAMGIGPELERG